MNNPRIAVDADARQPAWSSNVRINAFASSLKMIDGDRVSYRQP